MSKTNTTRVAVLGATGYVGGQVLAILANHPYVTVTTATTVRYAGQTLGDVFPALAPLADLGLTTLDAEAVCRDADVVLSALPHGHSARVLGEIADKGTTVIDLSADYRFSDPAAYQAAYGQEHPRPELAEGAVYGLVEHHREAVSGANLIGVPGCYPTATLLALLPLVKAGWVDASLGAVVDAKSGISGAGREAKTANLFCEVDGGTRAYNVGIHRHQQEMAFQARALGGAECPVFFTPQVVPMTRGILASVYVHTPEGVGVDANALHAEFARTYADARFGTVLPLGSFPDTKNVAGTNRFAIGVAAHPETRKLVVLCAIDNLIKGAAGQGVQCLNALLGLPEETALPMMGGVV